MPRPFLPYPDRRLAAVAATVEAVTDEVRAIWDEMLEAMYAMPGVGLAAPQLGIGLRLAVVDCSQGGERAPVRMANPELIEVSEAQATRPEASPNLPGVSAEVTRPATVTVSYLSEKGLRERREFEGLWATSVQHQIDHLDGKLFIDRLSKVKRRMVLAKYAKAQRRK